VRKSMTTLGVSESQMEAVSLGEEKPKATGRTKPHGLKTAAPTSSTIIKGHAVEAVSGTG
jgi:outer membrane protein OmpA-like peptidoglycan-associated protein